MRFLPKNVVWLPVSLLAVVFIVIAEFQVLQAAGLSRGGHVALAIVGIAALCWVTEVVPLFVTSFGIIALGTIWLQPVLAAEQITLATNDLLAPFFSNIILLFLGGFVLSGALHVQGLDESLARLIIRHVGSSPGRLMLGMMGVTAVLSMWLSNTATAAMMLGLITPIVNGMPAGDKGRKALVLCIPFAANVGGLGTPIGTPPNAIAVAYASRAGDPVSFLEWMMIGTPFVVVMLIAAWIALRILFPSDVREIATPATNSEPVQPGKWRNWVVLTTLFVTAAGWLTGDLHGLKTGTVALLPVIVLFASRVIPAEAFRRLPWDVLMLVGGGLCLGTIMERSGLAVFLIDQLPIDQLSPGLLLGAIAVVACVLSSMMSNTATANLMMPLIAGMSLAAPATGMTVVAIACSMAMALPISTPPNAIAFSSPEITTGDLLKPGVLLSAIGVGLAVTVGQWWVGVVCG